MSTDGDVSDLMNELRRRVAEKKAAGIYTLDGLSSTPGSDTEPFRVQELIWLDEVAEITPRHEPRSVHQGRCRLRRR